MRVLVERRQAQYSPDVRVRPEIRYCPTLTRREALIKLWTLPPIRQPGLTARTPKAHQRRTEHVGAFFMPDTRAA